MYDHERETLFYCFVIVIFNAMVLLVYHFKVDPYKDVERYYFQSNKLHYCVFKLAYSIILISFIFSLRYVFYYGFNHLKTVL